MSVTVAAMSMAELTALLAQSGEYATLAEAMAAYGLTITEGVGATGTALSVVGGPASTAVGTVGETALELAARAQLQATGTGVATSGVGLSYSITGFSLSGLLATPVGVVGAALAPYYGVKLGVGLYESNPEFWTKLSQRLLPFCYPGTTSIPTWADIASSTWAVKVGKDVADAVRDFLIDNGVIDSSGYVEDLYGTFNDGTEYPIGKAKSVTQTTWEYCSWYDPGNPGASPYHLVSYSSWAIVGRSGQNLVVHNPTDSEIRYWGARNDYTHSTTDSFVAPHSTGIFTLSGSYTNITLKDSGVSTTSLSTSIESGVDSIEEVGTPGTERWTGTVPETIPQASPAVVGIDPNTGTAVTRPMVPISPPIIIIPDPIEDPQPEPQAPPEIVPFPWPKPATVPEEEPWPETMPWPLPATEPNWWPVEIPYPNTYPYQYPSADPEEQPDPNVVTDPSKQIEPYIIPSPYPYTQPVPETKPITNPSTDPSNPTRPTIKIDTQPPASPDEPPPSGISPVASFPDTPLPFDISQNVGLVTVYHPTAAQLYAFERWLWVTYADATIDKIFNNPFDGVISLFEIYCTPTDVATQTIRSGFLNSGISSAVISRYTEIDCGTLGIPEYYGNYFDYSPYSKAHIYLPFIGIQELNVDDIVGHAVNVKYRIDEYNGSCIAMITVARVTEVAGEDVEYSNTTYQFSGNCSVELPFAGGSQAAIKAGMMQADAWQTAANVSAGVNLVGGIASTLAAAGVGKLGSIPMAMGGASQALSSIGTMYSGQAQYISNMLSGKATVQKSGGFGSSHGALGIKTPFITVTRPKQIRVANYNEEYGYPAHKLVYVGDCTGFLRCREVHVVSTTATDDEKDAIEALLKSGIYVTE